MAGMAKMVGYLENHCKGIAREENWQRRFYVLLPASEKNQARLDWYESEKDFKQNCHADQTKRKTIYIEEMESVEDPEDSLGKKYCFSIRCKDRVHLFAAELKHDRNQWRACLSDIIEQTKSPSTSDTQSATDSFDDLSSENSTYETANISVLNFRIEVLSTGASDKAKLHGEFDLEISLRDITIKDVRTRLKACSWPIKGIRRYGKSKSNFTFESGRRCDTGDGLWKFKTPEGDAIFNAIQRNTNRMKELDKKSMSAKAGDFAPASNICRKGSVEVVPDVPVRKYDAGSYVSIVQGSQEDIQPGSASGNPRSTGAGPATAKKPNDKKIKSLVGKGKKGQEVENKMKKDIDDSVYANVSNETSYESRTKPNHGKDAYTYASAPQTGASRAAAGIRTADDYSEPANAIRPQYGDGDYAEPEIVQGQGAKMSDIVAGIKMGQKSHRLAHMEGTQEYDHIVLSKKPSVGPKPGDNTYDRLDGADGREVERYGTYAEIPSMKPSK